SPSLSSTRSGIAPVPFVPLVQRLKSFGWRQRAPPPANFRHFSQASIFVSTLHLLRHAHKLSFLVLDADMDEMERSDILVALKELALREAPLGETPEKVSVMLCGPIKEWEGFLKDLVDTFKDIKELFIDRPLRKSSQAQATFESFVTGDFLGPSRPGFVIAGWPSLLVSPAPHIRSANTDFSQISLLEPLTRLPYLQLVQVGSYTFTVPLQTSIVLHLARMVPSLLVVGLLSEEGETVWWGIWRRSAQRLDVTIQPLGDGHLRILEQEARKWMPLTPADAGMTPPATKKRRRVSDNDTRGEGDPE
ncbi:hypothetical protein P7C73_g4370, partial [Tremellales sp. Uapishka_1]